MMKYLFVLSFLLCINQGVKGQGCSDAGFCTIESFKPSPTDSHETKCLDFKTSVPIFSPNIFSTTIEDIFMLIASEIKAGTVLRFDERLYRVLDVIRHAGSGQMHGFIELKLLDLKFHHFADKRFKHSDKLDVVELTKKVMEYLYSDSDNFYFMDTVTFEQCTVPSFAVGNYGKFIKEGTNFTVELNGEEAIAIQFPKLAEITIVSTGEGIKDGQDNTMKSATLENGLEIFVPQFIETGDVIHVDTEKLKYHDRIAFKKL